MLFHILISIRNQAISQRLILEDLKHCFRHGLIVPGREEANGCIVEIETVNLRSRHDYGDTLRHKLHDLRAISFVSKRVSALWNDPNIGVCDNIRNLMKGKA